MNKQMTIEGNEVLLTGSIPNQLRTVKRSENIKDARHLLDKWVELRYGIPMTPENSAMIADIVGADRQSRIVFNEENVEHSPWN